MKWNLQRAKRVYGIVTAVSLTVSGVCLISACLDIYNAGAFSPQAVADAFSPIAIAVYFSIALILGGWVLALAAPEVAEKPKVSRQTGLILARLQAKADWEGCEDSLKAAVTAQQKKRRLVRLVQAVILTVCTAVFLAYALDGSHFDTNINGSMIRAMVVAVPCLVVSLAVSLIAHSVRHASMEQEIALLKQAPSGKAAPQQSAKQKLPWLRYAVLAAAVGILVYGYCTGGTVDVLTKAVNICTECVGLG